MKPIAPRQERPASRSASSAPGRRAWPRPSSCAPQATRSHVYDRYDRVGGLLIYGIPGFKLEKDVVLRRWKRLEEGGVSLPPRAARRRPRRPLDGAARAARRGADRDRRLQGARHRRRPAPGCGGIVAALDYLTASNRSGLGDAVPEFDSGAAQCRGQARGRDRRRRHRDGLRAHRGAPGRRRR